MKTENPIDRVDFNFLAKEVLITKRDGSVERLSFAKMEQDTKMSLLPNPRDGQDSKRAVVRNVRK